MNDGTHRGRQDAAPKDAVTLTRNALQARFDVNGFFGSNASNPIGAAQAAVNAGRSGEVPVVGMDAPPEAADVVCDGAVAARKARRPWDVGRQAMRRRVAMNRNPTIPMDHDTGPRSIARDDGTG